MSEKFLNIGFVNNFLVMTLKEQVTKTNVQMGQYQTKMLLSAMIITCRVKWEYIEWEGNLQTVFSTRNNMQHMKLQLNIGKKKKTNLKHGLRGCINISPKKTVQKQTCSALHIIRGMQMKSTLKGSEFWNSRIL